MKKWLTQCIALCYIAFIAGSCENNAVDEKKVYFLSDIRPQFFENLNFESKTVLAEIPFFLRQLTKSYTELESEYQAGMFKSTADLENMRLIGMYYSFYLLALGGNYMDGNLTFADIQGDNSTGLFSKASNSTPGFEKQELNAMMLRAQQVAKLAIDIHGFNDKTYGFYVSVRQVQERLKTPNFTNNPATQDSVIEYVGTNLVFYDQIPEWNLLMAMVTFSNYADSLNTFKYENLNFVLNNVNARLVPGRLEDLGGKYPEILGPIYRFDINLKKIDWMMETKKVFNERELRELDRYISVLDTASHFVETKKKRILDTWIHKATFEERKQKLREIKDFRASFNGGTPTQKAPTHTVYLNSKSFKKAYQCYSCHRNSGL